MKDFMRVQKIAVMLLAFILLSTLIPHRSHAMSVSAESAVLMEQVSGRVLFEKNAHEKKRIASITKIMTAILAVESGKLNEKVTISGRAFGVEGSSLYLQQGQKMKLKDLVYGLMLRSGNDAAVAIAEHVGGSLEGFVHLMNEKAQEIGMKDTSFTNPHGLDNTPNHYSTAYDMALLTRYAMNNPTYAEIAGTKNHKAPNPNEAWDYSWNNKNKMLKLYKYSTGGKTGFTKLAHRTLVSTATKGDLSLVAVTLNAGDDWNDHMSMFDSGFEKYQLVPIMKSGKLKKLKNAFYKNKAVILEPFYYPLAEAEKEKLHIELKLIKPQKNWNHQRNVPSIVGKAYIMLDNQVIGTRNIHYSAHVKIPKTSFLTEWVKTFQMIARLSNDG